MYWWASGRGGGNERFVSGRSATKGDVVLSTARRARAGVKLQVLGFKGQKFRFRFSKIGIENRNRVRFSIPIPMSKIGIENRFRFPIWRQSNRPSESEIEPIGIGGIDGDRHPLSIISLLVRGTRLGNRNLHLMGWIYAYKCKLMISEITDRQDLVWGNSISGISLSGAHSQFIFWCILCIGAASGPPPEGLVLRPELLLRLRGLGARRLCSRFKGPTPRQPHRPR